MPEYELIYNTRVKLPEQPPHEQILNWDKPKEEQYWVREELPEMFDHVTYNKSGDLLLTAAQEAYAEKEVEKCKKGIWIYINGKPTYLTGKHYFYLQFWVLEDGSRPDYRDCDRRYYTFLWHWEKIEACHGILRAKKRREGASSQATSNLIYECIFFTNSNCGLISKTRDDSRDTFTDMVGFGYRHLPPFLKPKQINKEDSVTEYIFEQKSANIGEKTSEIRRSKVNYRAPVLNAYDRGRMSRVLLDEGGKLPVEVPADQLFAILDKTLIKGVKRVGFVEMPSTVNKLSKGGAGFKRLWDNADIEKKWPTVNRLVRYFCPAHDGYEGFIGKYGESIIDAPTPEQYEYLVKKWVKKDDDGNVISELSEDDIKLGAKAYIQNRRVGKTGDDLEEEIRMNPENETEIFMSANADCIFDLLLINEQISYLEKNPVYKRKIVFYRDLDQSVKWRDLRQNETALHWEWVGDLSRPQKPTYYDGGLRPARPEVGVIGVDGISNEQGGKRYGSKASAWCFLKYNINDPENTGLFAGHLYGRPREKSELYDQIMFASEYFGFPIAHEHVADDYHSYFKKRGRLGLLMRYPLNAIAPEKRNKPNLERHYGYPTTPFAISQGNDAMIQYILHYCHKIYWTELLEDLKEYDPEKRTPSDRSVSAMIALVSALDPVRKPPPLKAPIVKVYPTHAQSQ